MSQTYAELEREARLLSAEEQAQLVDALLESLRDEKIAEVEAAWAVEIERRVSAYERGEAKLVPAEEVFAKAYRRLVSQARFIEEAEAEFLKEVQYYADVQVGGAERFRAAIEEATARTRVSHGWSQLPRKDSSSLRERLPVLPGLPAGSRGRGRHRGRSRVQAPGVLDVSCTLGVNSDDVGTQIHSLRMVNGRPII